MRDTKTAAAGGEKGKDMNAPAIRIDKAVDGLEAEPVYRIPLLSILLGENYRKHVDPKKLAELVADFKTRKERGDEHIVQQPILVRPSAKAPDLFEVVYGGRRYRAAVEAELDWIPASVRNLTDEQVLELQVVENSQRADVHPLEEADAFKTWHEEYGKSIPDIAAKIGRSEAHVYQRLKLTELCKEARKAFLEGQLSPAVALVLARVPGADLQKRALTDLTKHASGDPISPRVAISHIRTRFMLRLADAPFPVADAVLVRAAGACTTCPKRTGNQRELFDDVVGDKQGGGPDICTDPKCYRSKSEAAFTIKAAAAKSKGVKVVGAGEAKKMWPYENDGNYFSGYNAGYKKTDENHYDDGKTRKLRDVLGSDAPQVYLAQNPHTGAAVELYKADEVQKILASRARKSKAKGSPATPSKPGAVSTARAKEEREQRVHNTVIHSLVTSVEVGGISWKVLAGLIALDDALVDQDELIERRWPDLDEDRYSRAYGEKVRERIAAYGEAEANGFVFEYLLALSGVGHDLRYAKNNAAAKKTAGGKNGVLGDLVQELAVDLGSIRRDAEGAEKKREAEAKAAEKAAAAAKKTAAKAKGKTTKKGARS